MKILTADEMRATDKATIQDYGIASTTLMLHAGEAIGRFARAEFPSALRILVLCGKGNNGGDGLVAATALAAAGREVSVLLLGSYADLKGDPAAMYERSQPAVKVIEVADETALQSPSVEKLLVDADLLIDAVVGTGFKPPLRGLAAVIRDRVNQMPTPVLAVDLPSGWDADSREYKVEGAMRADAVVTFTAAKLAHVCGNLTASAYKPIVVAPIGSPDETITSSLKLTWAGSAKKITERPREADDNKGRHGHVLIVGGAHGKAGAPSMASLAALRMGAGLVTTAVPESILNTVARITPELMTMPLAEGKGGEIAAGNFDEAGLKALLEKKTVVAVGPGLGQTPDAEQLVLALLDHVEVPLVLDADALNILAKHLDRLDDHPGRPVILTPHPGEMGRLANLSVKEVQSQREPLAREFAQRYGVTLVLKGWRTLIAHPSKDGASGTGAMAINTTGNPGMAKGGSGDILTGMVAAMVAQYPQQLEEAVNAAVYLHGLAADLAVRGQDEHTLLATDVVAHLWKAFRFRAADKNGYVWYQGMPT
jgi:hydroxyethylthiazole kinase-like uncharacterized protein yjeF